MYKQAERLPAFQAVVKKQKIKKTASRPRGHLGQECLACGGKTYNHGLTN